MKSLTISLALVILAGFAVAGISRGAETATVSATVTAQNVSVTVTDGTIAYGFIPVSSSSTTVSLTDTQTATNNGNVAEDLDIRSTDATGGTAWTLSGTTIGSDQYKHSFSINSGGAWTAMTSSYATLADNKAAAGDQTFDLKIETPSATTDFTEKSITVTVMASAH